MDFSVTRLVHTTRNPNTRQLGVGPMVLRTYNVDAPNGAVAGRIADEAKHATEHDLGWCPHRHNQAP